MIEFKDEFEKTIYDEKWLSELNEDLEAEKDGRIFAIEIKDQKRART